MWADFDAFVRDHGAPALPEIEFMHESPYLNLYVYPEEVDYERTEPLAPTWHRLECSVRRTDDDWTVPEPLASRRREARLPEPGEPGIGRPRADAAARRLPRRDRRTA